MDRVRRRVWIHWGVSYGSTRSTWTLMDDLDTYGYNTGVLMDVERGTNGSSTVVLWIQ